MHENDEKGAEEGWWVYTQSDAQGELIIEFVAWRVHLSNAKPPLSSALQFNLSNLGTT